MNVIEWIKQNAPRIDCETLEEINDAAMFAAIATSDIGGDAAAAAWLAIDVGLQAAWYAVGCGDTPPPSIDIPNWPADQKCQKVSAPSQLWYRKTLYDGNQQVYEFGSEYGALEVVNVVRITDRKARIFYRDQDNVQQDFEVTSIEPCIFDAYIVPRKNTYCVGQEPPVYPPNGRDPIGPPIVVPTDDLDEDCEYTITPVNSYIDRFNVYWTQYHVTNDDPVNCGTDFYYWGSQNGPYFCPKDGIRCEPPDATGGGEYDDLSGTTYYLEGWCEDPAEWGQPDWENVYLEYDIPQANPFLGLALRIDTLAQMLSDHILFKTPTCHEQLDLAPYWRSIRFESEEYTDRGNRRLDKLLRYRGAEPGDVDFLAGYWGDFEWTTGPVCVYHKGSPVGTPQVWADSEEEGKRVLRHAFGEAGFDADQIGQWGVSGSSDPRYGVRHKVKLKVVDGCWSATSRPGPGGWPEAGIALPDPYGSGSNSEEN